MKRWPAKGEQEAAQRAASEDRRGILTANGHAPAQIARTFLTAYERLGCTIAWDWQQKQPLWNVAPDAEAQAFALINELTPAERSSVVSLALGWGQAGRTP